VAVVRLVFFARKNTIRLQYKQGITAEARYNIIFQLCSYKYKIYPDIDDMELHRRLNVMVTKVYSRQKITKDSHRLRRELLHKMAG